jgi:hypothetical protein
MRDFPIITDGNWALPDTTHYAPSHSDYQSNKKCRSVVSILKHALSLYTVT